MTKKIIIFFSLCLISIAILQAQNKKAAEETQKIEGTVTDFFGVPWEGVTLKLKSSDVHKSLDSGKEKIIEKDTKTDVNGHYRFVDLPEDNYAIKLEDALTREETKQTGILFNGETSKLDFGVEVGEISQCRFIVGGFVKDNQGKAIEGAKITVFNAFNQRDILSGTTNKKGLYEITLCSLGQYVVFANTPKYQVQTTNITFEKWNDFFKKVDFTLTPLSEERLHWRH